jgi:Alkaline phosphatase
MRRAYAGVQAAGFIALILALFFVGSAFAAAIFPIDRARIVAGSILSRNQDGFVLMVEAGLIDKYNHPLDWERSVYDTIMLLLAVAASLPTLRIPVARLLRFA